jgi:DNA-binding NarL/FixJ family response regulator
MPLYRLRSWKATTDMKPIRILLADDHTVVRDGLRALLEHESDMAVVGEAADGRESVRLAETEAPDIVVMDLAMPIMNGMEATRRILANNTRVGVVILSMHQDESYVLGALKAGAKGYLLKDSVRGELLQAIRAVSQGRSFLTRKIARILQEDYIRRLEQRGLQDRHDLLSDREREILQMIAEGRSNKEVANLLHISLTTVETHRGHILQKLDLHSIPELILYAVRKGIIS